MVYEELNELFVIYAQYILGYGLQKCEYVLYYSRRAVTTNEQKIRRTNQCHLS